MLKSFKPDKQKRKRVKVKCECGSEFDLDYRNKHEALQHNGQRKKIKHLNAPENPFEAAKRTKKNVSETEAIPEATETNISLWLEEFTPGPTPTTSNEIETTDISVEKPTPGPTLTTSNEIEAITDISVSRFFEHD